MSFSFGGVTTAASTFGTTTSSTGFPFGGGDASKQMFGGAANPTDNKAGAFNFSSPTAPGTQAQSQPFGGFALSPGNKTTAATSSLFASPTATNAGQATFGAAKPLGGFGAPPNQTVGSPGFGQQAQAQSTPFALTSQQSAPPAFGAQPTNQVAATAFGTPTPASAGSMFGGFGKPAQTATPTGFGFSTPASGFSQPAQPAPAATTATSQATPAFGQTTFGAKPGSFNFGSAAPTSTTAAAPSFGTPANVPAPAANLSFGGGNTGMGFGGQTAQPNTGLSFGNLTAAAPTTQATIAFGQAQPAPQTTQPTSQPTQPTAQQPLNFGTATSQATGFGQPTSQPALSFGSHPPIQAAGGMGFGGQATPQPPGLTGFGGTTSTPASTGLSFGTPSTVASTTAPTTIPAFGTTPASSASETTPNFGIPASSANKPGLFGAPATTAVATTGLNFGTPSTVSAPTTGVGFGSTPASSTATAPTTGLNFGSTPASSAATGINFGTATSTGLGFAAKPTSTTATTSSAPSGITSLAQSTAATALTTMPSLTTTAAPLVPPQPISSISFAELEESINKWTLELEEQEKTFINQATQINAWDKLLIANGEKIVELNEVVQTVKNEQQSLEHELDFVLVQQKELEDLLAPMEKQLENAGDRVRDPEREQMYTLAENLDSQLKQMSEDLKEVIEHLNETNRGQDSNDPIVQIGRILNTHMSSMQWIDTSINQISNKLDLLKTTHDTLRRENERSFQLTYN